MIKYCQKQEIWELYVWNPVGSKCGLIVGIWAQFNSLRLGKTRLWQVNGLIILIEIWIQAPEVGSGNPCSIGDRTVLPSKSTYGLACISSPSLRENLTSKFGKCPHQKLIAQISDFSFNLHLLYMSSKLDAVSAST